MNLYFAFVRFYVFRTHWRFLVCSFVTTHNSRYIHVRTTIPSWLVERKPTFALHRARVLNPLVSCCVTKSNENVKYLYRCQLYITGSSVLHCHCITDFQYVLNLLSIRYIALLKLSMDWWYNKSNECKDNSNRKVWSWRHIYEGSLLHFAIGMTSITKTISQKWSYYFSK